MYNKQQGRPNYQNFGPVEVANYQNGATSYRGSHTAASGTPNVDTNDAPKEEYCSLKSNTKVKETISNIALKALEAYIIYLDFKSGSEVAILRNYGDTAVGFVAGFESIIPNSDTPMAKSLSRKITCKIWELESNTYSSTAHNVGLVYGDLGGIAFDLFLLGGVGAAAETAEGAGTVIKAGDTLVAVQESAGALKGVAGLSAGFDAFWNSTNLGKDLNSLINEIKGKNSSSGKNINELGDADIKDLDRLPQEVIDKLGGEDYTREAKAQAGGSRSDLYWDIEGNVYSVPKNGGPPQLVDKVDRSGLLGG